MKKILGIMATLVLALGITTTSFAATNLTKPASKTKSAITKTNKRNSSKPKKHRSKRKAKKSAKKTTTMAPTK